MTKLKDIYTKYFQKSKGFLYPALGIAKGTSVTPIETYMGFNDEIHYTDKKLVCLYYLRDDMEFTNFEEKRLLGNKLFDSFKQVNDEKALYIFDFEEYSEDWDNVILGKYSKLSDDLKKAMKTYCGKHKAAWSFMESYIYPDKYFEEYAKHLTTGKPDDVKKMVIQLKEVGELCPKPDLEKEILKMEVQTLENKRNIT